MKVANTGDLQFLLCIKYEIQVSETLVLYIKIANIKTFHHICAVLVSSPYAFIYMDIFILQIHIQASGI